MIKLRCLINRNTKLFFKDKGMFFTAMITPLILLVLYISFLSGVYKDSFLQGLSQSDQIPERLVDGLVGGQLMSSLLAVCCVTVAFCSNMLMVQDKANGARDDIAMTTVSGGTLAASYFISTAISTLIVCGFACGVSFIYLGIIGWYLSISDVFLILLDVLLLSLFGTALSSTVNHFLSTQGQISLVGSIISSTYGFVCGAYMPISQFSGGLRNCISMLPGTYGTSLMRRHTMSGAFKELSSVGVSDEEIEILKDVVDSNVYCFGTKVSISTKYVIILASVLLFTMLYVILNRKFKKTKE